MEKITDWRQLWKELVAIKSASRSNGVSPAPRDPWNERALAFKQGVLRRWQRPDSSRNFILSQLDADSTVRHRRRHRFWAALPPRAPGAAVEPSRRSPFSPEAREKGSATCRSWRAGPNLSHTTSAPALCGPDLEAFIHG